MDEQLEHALEGAGAETALHEKTAVQVPSQNTTPEETTQTGGEEEMNQESPTEEAENASAAGLSASTAKVVLPPSQGTGPLSAEEGRASEGRDYYAEWKELAEAHPEVVGKELPEDIYQACMQSDLPPLRVYESMMLQKQNEQIVALQKEIATLRQNAENTARAPVVAAAEGPANEPEDLFMKGFNSY
jgi:hypothetical protein